MSLDIQFSCAYEEYVMYAKKDLKASSFKTIISRFEHYILPYFKDYSLQDITSKIILEWEDCILLNNFSNEYNTGIYYALSGFFNFCRKHYGFDKTIIENVGCFKKKYEEKKSKVFTIDEFKLFIKYVEDPIYKQFFTFLFFTGVRKGEAMALKFSDLNNSYIAITKTMDSHGKREITTPKTKSSIRTIVIDRTLNKDLLKLERMYQEKYNRIDDFYIFGGIKPISSTTADRKKLEACKKANLQPITLHQFRHSHATYLLNKKMNINEVSRRLGHSKTSTTLDIYTHTDLEQEKRVLHTLNSARINPITTLKSILISILKRLQSL